MPYQSIPPSPVFDGTVGGTTPSPVGTGAEGSSGAVARVDHVHGLDAALNGKIVKVTAGAPAAAVAGTDYLAPLSISDTWKVEAAADLGVSASDLIFITFGDDDSSLWSNAVIGSGKRFFCQDAQHGLRFSTEGVANSGFVGTYPVASLNSTVAQHFPTGLTGKWWMKARMAMNPSGSSGGPAGAATVLGMGARSNTTSTSDQHDLLMGVEGNGGNFVLNGSAGSSIDSGLVVDALVRDHKGHRDGVNSYYHIDGVLKGTSTVRPATAAQTILLCFDTAATKQVLDIYVAVVAFPVRALGA